MKDLTRLILNNKYYYLTILFFIIGEGILLLFASKEEVTLWVNQHHSPYLDSLFLYANNMGEVWFSLLVLYIIGISKGRRYLLLAVVCMLVAIGVTFFTKHFLFPGTLRPVPYFEGKEALRLLEGVVQLQTESFPSGHSTAAFSVFTIIALIYASKQWHWIGALLAFSVAYTRIYLSQHFITDVYVGMIIGVVVTTLIYFLIKEKTNLFSA